MQVFNCCFPVGGATIDEVVETALKWRRGSQHSRFLETDLDVLATSEECNISRDGQELSINKVLHNSEELCGIRYAEDDKDGRWITDVIAVNNRKELWVSVSVSYDCARPKHAKVLVKKPYIIKMLFSRFDVECDGPMPSSDAPILLKEGDVAIAKAIIEGSVECVMPIVYVSASGNGVYSVDINRLSRIISGMAHVVVDPSSMFSKHVMHVVGDNPYNGAVGIYWGDCDSWRIVPKQFRNEKSATDCIFNVVRESLLSFRMSREVSWQRIREIKARIKIDELKKSGSEKVDDYVDAFDEENKMLREENRNFERQLYDLQRQLSRSEASMSTESLSVLLLGDEKELYFDEAKSIVCDILNSAVESMQPGMRRYDVVKSLIGANVKEDFERNFILSGLKECMKDYKKMGPKVRSSLGECGFLIEEDGKHYKLKFRDDERYVCVLPKTSSDSRAGKNTAHDIIRNFL